MPDVIVIGGGPGGLYTALQLSKNGLEVTVVEEHACIGRPVHCTGILSADAFDEFDLPRTAFLNDLKTATFYSPSGQQFSYTPDRTEAVVVDRAVFDETLSLAAEAAGAATVRGKKVTAIRIDNDCVRVELGQDGEAMHARACVLACGANYSLHRTLGLGVPSLFSLTAQAEFPSRHSGNVELHFGTEVAPKGFAWAVPVRRRGENWARVGLMCASSSVEERFHSFASSIATRWGIPSSQTIEPVRKMLPLAPISRTYGDRLLVIGDAAGLVKPTTGGGIYYSILSAAFAAETLIQSFRSGKLDASTLAGYSKRWKNRMSSELEAQLSFRRHAEQLLDSDIEDLFELVRTDGVLPVVRRSATFNQHRRLILDLLRHAQFRGILLRRVFR